MSKNGSGSVAPKERINIKYVPNTGDQVAEIELPLNLLIVGDLKGTKEDTPIEERQAVSVNKNNFNAVMNEANINLTFSVPNRLNDNNGDDLPVNLEIKSLNDFSPDNVAKKVPELNKLLELREALVALKGPLGNIPAFRTRLQELLGDEKVREQLLKELEIVNQK
ncbi:MULTISPECIES: type VI secretion system contractile sheath small subunit [Photorhabdus]|uniref:Type VI secretion system contractile sheath small subunit n=1 Tax=Photorhabdus bodei TaxID=2029681 RepID=A0A329X5W8_9GAMM|nr:MULTISPECIES: type VI secretion system contractile sheath small subunit [Photorhabdus]MCT8344560.1 type VI secretion system contractile sheath small subunit [Photorhabdus kleinii]NDL00755.1 type VI secretion system contractile sheath small subunit [Photorhabdus bodei]NDL04921.1 type VI secretion system contractile sheath small subunit [Photorhabdus bodei]NDL09254.1 type VI secretion system contractile sheath small subunit [Photorhabdus bodei]RAW97477.1 type VI secretion system contractile s